MYKHIVIEGIHGSGKSSVAKGLAQKLQKLGYKAQYYHFPDEGDKLGQVIRTTIADKDLCMSREVTGLLYAAFSNRFHIKTQQDKITYIQDRDSVTTGLIFQKTMPRKTRLDVYKFGIENLKKQGIVFYVKLDKDIALQRMQKRNKELKENQNDQVRKDKANDTFLEKFDQLSQEYNKQLGPQIKKLGIPFYTVNNNNSIENTINQILEKLKIS